MNKPNLNRVVEDETIASMTTLSTQPYKGTRDYYPEDKQLQNYIFAVWRRAVESYGYQEYGAPTLEPLEIYAAKSGQELVNEQTYTFTDRGGREVAIRPEMTPTISRMVAARRQELAYPARLYSIANFMRYERPQRGREREFWQLNVDLFGVEQIAADAEIITIADTIMKDFGATPEEYVIRINSRGLVNEITGNFLELDEARGQQLVKLLDRRNKITEQEFDEQAREIFGDEAGKKREKLDQLLAASGWDTLPASLKKAPALADIRTLFAQLEKAGVSNAVFDVALMRGLDYYTGVVFEVFDTHPDNNRALFGGGRYDGLVSVFGAEPLSAVGFAIGGTTNENFLSVHGLLPVLGSTTKAYIAVIDEALAAANELAARLRANDLNVEVDITGRKLDKQLKTAAKKGIPFVIFVGPEEAKSGLYTLRAVGDDRFEQKLTAEQLPDALV